MRQWIGALQGMKIVGSRDALHCGASRTSGIRQRPGESRLPRHPARLFSEQEEAILRTAIFGGTFDPIHRGHLQIARFVARHLQLDRVLFVTAARPPHKADRKMTAAKDRHAMVTLALKHEEQFFPSDIEISSRAKKNYTIDTIKRLRARLRRSDELFFIMGADQLDEFSSWRDVDGLLAAVAFVVISRPGLSFRRLLACADSRVRGVAKMASGKIPHGHSAKNLFASKPPAVYLLSGLKIGISSTGIRVRIAAGKSVSRWLDPAVIEYIRKHRLYQKPNAIRR